MNIVATIEVEGNLPRWARLAFVVEGDRVFLVSDCLPPTFTLSGELDVIQAEEHIYLDANWIIRNCDDVAIQEWAERTKHRVLQIAHSEEPS
jgi:hypothetical protein